MPNNTTTPVVVMCPNQLTEFLDVAVPLYEALVPDHPLPCFAVLLGTTDATSAQVKRLAFGGNARACDPAALEEFAVTIVPRFGKSYENTDRGYWLDPNDQLRIARQADNDGLEILGSMHMHPDWHRIGRTEAERTTPLSARPTQMDEHVFANTGWPVNIICYLERVNDVTCYTVEAWGPPPGDDRTQRCVSLPLRILFDRTTSRGHAA